MLAESVVLEDLAPIAQQQLQQVRQEKFDHDFKCRSSSRHLQPRRSIAHPSSGHGHIGPALPTVNVAISTALQQELRGGCVFHVICLLPRASQTGGFSSQGQSRNPIAQSYPLPRSHYTASSSAPCRHLDMIKLWRQSLLENRTEAQIEPRNSPGVCLKAKHCRSETSRER